MSEEHLHSILGRLWKNLPQRTNNVASPFAAVDAGVLFRLPVQEMPWIVSGYLARGILTFLAGPPKLGKSTLAYQLIKAVALGEPFLGRSLTRGNVLLLGLEEHQRDIVSRLRSHGGEGIEGMVKVVWGYLPFNKAKLKEITSYIQQEHIALVVVDTVHAWWGLDDENSAAEINRIGRMLLDAIRETEAAWLCLAHTRKSGGEHGQEIRGSSAILGIVDVALSLKRTESGDPQRCIESMSRYPETPRKLIITFEEGAYRVLGEPEDVDASAKAERIRLALTEKDAQTAEELAGATGFSRRDVDRGLVRLGNVVVRKGTGRKGNAFRYRLNSIVATPGSRGESLPETDCKRVNGA